MMKILSCLTLSMIIMYSCDVYSNEHSDYICFADRECEICKYRDIVDFGDIFYNKYGDIPNVTKELVKLSNKEILFSDLIDDEFVTRFGFFYIAMVAHENNPEVLKSVNYLIGKGVNPYFRIRSEMFLIQYVANSGSEEIFKLFVNSALIDSCLIGRQKLIASIEKDREEIMDILIPK